MEKTASIRACLGMTEIRPFGANLKPGWPASDTSAVNAARLSSRDKPTRFRRANGIEARTSTASRPALSALRSAITFRAGMAGTSGVSGMICGKGLLKTYALNA